MCNLGLLEGGTSGFSIANGVSANGTVVVGYGNTSSGGRAFRWVESTGMEVLGTLGGFTMAYGVNADGTVVVGRSDVAGGYGAFRWVEGVGMEYIGTLGGFSVAYAVNPAGTVVVGDSSTGSGLRAFRWTEGLGMENLGGSSSTARGVNADGTVVVGADNTGLNIAFRWVEGTGMQSLGTLSGGNTSFANGVSSDGSVVVGRSATSGGTRAFRWVANGKGGEIGNPQMENLGTLVEGDYSDASAVNADGTVVVGSSSSGEGTRAFRWVEGTGMESLGTLAGAISSNASGVSADGNIVVGTASIGMFAERAFIWRATSDGGTIEDFGNLVTSIPILANDSAVAQAQQQSAIGRTMDQRGSAQAGQSVLSAQMRVDSTGRNPTTVGARTSRLGALSIGRGITDQLTLGASLSVNNTSLKNNAFDMETGVGVAVWGEYSQKGAARTGVQASVAFGYIRSKGEVARGRLQTDVLLATGSAAAETRAAQATLGYGVQTGDWLVTPSIGVAHYETRRGAYTETGASFNASYDKMRTNRTVATLGVQAEFDVSARGRVSLGAGIDHELKPERPRLTGTSDIPGLATFDIASTIPVNRTRVFATVGYTHDFGNGSSLSGSLRVGDAVYGTTKSVGAGVTYGLRF